MIGAHQRKGIELRWTIYYLLSNEAPRLLIPCCLPCIPQGARTRRHIQAHDQEHTQAHTGTHTDIHTGAHTHTRRHTLGHTPAEPLPWGSLHLLRRSARTQRHTPEDTHIHAGTP
jgi:hypothetical protein